VADSDTQPLTNEWPLLVMVVNRSKQPMCLLDLPATVLDKIMVELFPPKVLYVCGIPVSVVPSLAAGQTTYDTAPDPELGRKTYIVVVPRTIQHCLDPAKVTHRKQPKSFCAAFLRVISTCNKLAAKYLYGQQIGFVDSAEGALAFLHDHRRGEHRLTNIGIFFSASSTTYRAATNPAAWRRLFNKLVHERPDLEIVYLIIRKDFWDDTLWEEGAELMFWYRDLCWEDTCLNGTDDPRNFLQHVARFQGKSVRSRVDNEPDVRISFGLKMHGIDGDAEKGTFAEALEQYMLSQMSQRPALREARYGSCSQKMLEHSCYWKRMRQIYNC